MNKRKLLNSSLGLFLTPLLTDVAEWRRDSIELQQCKVACIFLNSGLLNPITTTTTTANEEMGVLEDVRLFFAPNLLVAVTCGMEHFKCCLTRRLYYKFLEGKNRDLPHLFTESSGQCPISVEVQKEKIYLWISDDCRGNI